MAGFTTTTGGLNFQYPNRDTTNWDAVMSNSFTTISAHNHDRDSAGSGNALTDRSILLNNTGWLQGADFAGSGTVNLIRVNTSDEIELGATLSVEQGGSGATSFTDHGIILGSGTDPLSVTAAPTTGQLLVGSTSNDPILLNSQMMQGHRCHFWNLSFTHTAGVLTIAGADGTALSTTNPAYVTMASNVTPGRLVQHVITANQTLTASDMTGNTQGTTASIAWGENLLQYVCCFADSSDANLVFGITRLPNLIITPASSANIGDPSAANMNQQYGLFSFDDITESNYTSKAIGYIGSFRASKDASDAWTFTSLDVSDGAGQFNEARGLVFPTNQNGAAANTHFQDNGGTAPHFTTITMNYYIGLSGNIFVSVFQGGDGGTDGAGAVGLTMSTPFISRDSYINGTFDITAVTAQPAASSVLGNGTPLVVFRQVTNQSQLTNGQFTNGNRTVTGTLIYKAKAEA